LLQLGGVERGCLRGGHGALLSGVRSVSDATLGPVATARIRGVPQSLPTGPHAFAAPYTRAMLLGRERERQELDRLLPRALAGQSGVLALIGEPGIGKTALLGYAADNAGSLRVLRARGIEAEANVPFA